MDKGYFQTVFEERGTLAYQNDLGGIIDEMMRRLAALEANNQGDKE